MIGTVLKVAVAAVVLLDVAVAYAFCKAAGMAAEAEGYCDEEAV